jgi:1-acyl-sn-glycerol-3-phosphate acyltransferase
MQLLWRLINAVQAAYVALWTAFWVSVALVATTLVGSRRPGLWLARHIWAPGILWVDAVRCEVEGLERLDLSRPCFFAANHQSWVDIPVLFAALPVPVLFVAKRELGRVPFLGWFMKAMGMVLIDRADRMETVRSVDAAAERLRQGWSLLSFPEGTRTLDGWVQRFKTATFAAAIAAGAPVVPIALEGAGRVLPRCGFRPRPGLIRVAIGAPIPTAGLCRDDRAALACRAQREVERLLASLCPGAVPVPAASGEDGLVET